MIYIQPINKVINRESLRLELADAGIGTVIFDTHTLTVHLEDWQLDTFKRIFFTHHPEGVITVYPSSIIRTIAADGDDYCQFFVTGAPNTQKTIEINEEETLIDIDADGVGMFQLSADVSCIMNVVIDGTITKVIAL